MDEMNSMDARQMWHHRHHRKGILLLILLVIILAWTFGPQLMLAMQTSGYQAVFLSNGQVYFGKLSASGDFYKMSDIYYLQVTQPLQQASDTAKTPASAAAASQQPNLQLIKLGSELHGPEDTMFIERDKVQFWENMKPDSKVVDAINKYKVK